MTVTRPQLAKIWLTAKERGIAPDLVRSMTPAGSVGMLTVAEASELIDALVKGRPPDYSRVAARAPQFTRRGGRPADGRRPPTNNPPPRRPAGVYALPSVDALLADSHNISWLAEHWRHKDGTPWTELQVIDWLSKRRFSHGGPMSICRSAKDVAARIEFTKGLIVRTQARANPDAQQAVRDYRARVAARDPQFTRRGGRPADSTTKPTKAHEDERSENKPFVPLRALRGESPPPLRLVRSDRPQFEEAGP
jgi:hypothetical protein